MNLGELLRAVHDNGEKLSPLKDSRLSQYKSIFGDMHNDSEVLSIACNWHSRTDDYFYNMIDAIARANPDYSEAWRDIKAVSISAHEEKTAAYTSDSSSVIIIGSHTMLFLWTMNKAQMYGKRLERSEQLKLIAELFLHFGSLRQFGPKGLIWPRPITPPHKSAEEFHALVLLTYIQELFLVAHEMAHLAIARGLYITQKYTSHGNYRVHYQQFRNYDKKLDEELLADEIGIDLVLGCFPKDRMIIEIVLSAIFLLIRYYLWLNVALMNGESYEFCLCFARNSLFREKSDSICSDGNGADFIIVLLEELEQTLEPAALNASEALALILAKTTVNK